MYLFDFNEMYATLKYSRNVRSSLQTNSLFKCNIYDAYEFKTNEIRTSCIFLNFLLQLAQVNYL